MQLPLSRAVAPQLEWLGEVDSTNAALAARASTGLAPRWLVYATDHQTAGRGRMGREWTAPPGTSLAVSVLLTAQGVDHERLGWFPLAAGLAMTRAVAALLPDAGVGLKWPNDVQVEGLKVSGLLAEYVADAHAVVMGAGLNLTMTHEQLPTEQATSLTLHGANPEGLLDAALSRYLTELRSLHGDLAAADFDADRAGVRDAVAAACTTLGRDVQVHLPGGGELLGVAEGIDESGRLLVRPPGGAPPQPVAAGDVTHLRYE